VLHEYIRVSSSLLWMAVMVVIVAGVSRAVLLIFRSGPSAAVAARQVVCRAIVSALGLSTAIALLATTELRNWNAIGLFAATAALRMFAKRVA
jgi:hypothetical protein